MLLANLARGDQVFLDANTLIYHHAPHPTFGPACSQLIQRIENQELTGFTATPVLSEVAHRLMIFEAGTLPGWTLAGAKRRLQQQPNAVQGLSRFRQAIAAILQSRLQVLSVAPALILSAKAISQQTGLLSNDALLVAVMQAHGLTKLASGDTDFDRVPGITRYAPG